MFHSTGIFLRPKGAENEGGGDLHTLSLKPLNKGFYLLFELNYFPVTVHVFQDLFFVQNLVFFLCPA